MPEEVLFETEQRTDRPDVADYLRSVADRLEAGDPVTLRAGGESITLDPPATPTFEVKAEREGSELSVEFELEWDESAAEADGDADLAVE